MTCHICGQEAVGRCFTCGNLYCVRHGTTDCMRCETAIAPGDRRADRVSARPLPPRANHGWWRPLPAEDFEPPGCYVCQALTRQKCSNCQELYCKEHAGYSGMCKECTRSAKMGLYVFLFAVGSIVALVWLTTVMK